MSKRSVLVGLVLVALCAFLVLPVWAVDGAVSGNATVSFNKNVCYGPSITVSGLADKNLNSTFSLGDSSLPFKFADSSLNVASSIFLSDSSPVDISFSDNTFNFLFDYSLSNIPDNFKGSISLSSSNFAINGIFSVGGGPGGVYGQVVESGNYGLAFDGGFRANVANPGSVGSDSFLYFEYFFYDKYNNLLAKGNSRCEKVSGGIFPMFNFPGIEVTVSSVPASIVFRRIFTVPSLQYHLVPTSTYSKKPNASINFGVLSNNNYFSPTGNCTYPLMQLPYSNSSVEFFSPDKLNISYTGNTVSAGGDYTSLLNVIISRLDTIIEKMGTGGSGGSTDLSGVETRLDSIIQKLGEVSPMADFEDSYIQNFGGQLDGVESSLSGKDNSLPSGGDMTGFTGALQSSLGIDSAGFSQADFDSAVSSLGGDKVNEGMPWYFFTQAVADSMVTPPSGVSVHSDVSPSDVWVADSERWRRLWSTPY